MRRTAPVASSHVRVPDAIHAAERALSLVVRAPSDALLADDGHRDLRPRYSCWLRPAEIVQRDAHSREPRGHVDGSGTAETRRFRRLKNACITSSSPAGGLCPRAFSSRGGSSPSPRCQRRSASTIAASGARSLERGPKRCAARRPIPRSPDRIGACDLGQVVRAGGGSAIAQALVRELRLRAIVALRVGRHRLRAGLLRAALAARDALRSAGLAHGDREVAPAAVGTASLAVWARPRALRAGHAPHAECAEDLRTEHGAGLHGAAARGRVGSRVVLQPHGAPARRGAGERDADQWHQPAPRATHDPAFYSEILAPATLHWRTLQSTPSPGLARDAIRSRIMNRTVCPCGHTRQKIGAGPLSWFS